MIFYQFLLWEIFFSCVCFTIFTGDLISGVYHFCIDLKSLFTAAAMSRMQTEVANKALIDSDAYMHAYTQCKAKHHPLFIWSLCSPIKSFIGFIDPISARLEVLVSFYFHRNHCVSEWSWKQRQGKYNQNQLRLFKLRIKMQSGKLTLQNLL